MSYEVLARKWRPRQFADVVGQDHVVQTLKNAIESGRIAHAYLFVGPRGIGKTSIARILAKSLNCEKGPSVNPCDKCDSCCEIAAGTSFDVLEIDGASNNGVEQVRELRETLKYAPTRGSFKIYIIDEVHMLSTAAFNALLKTLEEPPPHVKFIFATTEPDKVLATIVSRCQRFDLRRIPDKLIIERLKAIADEEKIKIDDDAMIAIARGAEGGLRDAESALDQLIAFCGRKISEDDVLKVFGLVARARLDELVAGILKGDVKMIISSVAELDGAGKDLVRLVFELLEHFRNLLICMHLDDPGKTMDVTETQVKVFREQVKLTDAERVLRIADILIRSYDRMRYALSRRTLLETALIRCARTASVVSIEELLKKINDLKSGLPASALAGVTASSMSTASYSVTVSEKKKAGDQYASTPVKASSVDPGKELAAMVRKWPEIVERVARIAPLVRGVLTDAVPVAVEGSRVSISFDPEFAEEIGNFESGRGRKAVEYVLKSLLKREITVDFIVGSDAQSVEPVGEENGRADSEVVFDDEGEKGKSDVRTLQNWIKDPVVRKILEKFDGTILRVRE